MIFKQKMVKTRKIVSYQLDTIKIIRCRNEYFTLSGNIQRSEMIAQTEQNHGTFNSVRIQTDSKILWFGPKDSTNYASLICVY